MPVRSLLAVAAAVLFLCGGCLTGQEIDQTPRLLLTKSRLRRLQRDRDRQTVRWLNFETRVQSVPDSPERGFELALYYAITRQEARGREAVGWALAHRCSQREVALILDWCSDLISPTERQALTAPNCQPLSTSASPAKQVRDNLFLQIASGQAVDFPAATWQSLTGQNAAALLNEADLYALCEFLTVYRSEKHLDLRQDQAHFFSILPKEFLLSLKPASVEHPDWRTHIAALSLVALDPNLESSQFLQGWTIEERQMLREGPGVAYEFLWADPYLPGIAYQNLDPWIYDPAGRFFARSDWGPKACWVGIASGSVDYENCAFNPRKANRPVTFGSLTILPAPPSCTEIPPRKNSESVLFWDLPPHAAVTFDRDRQPGSTEADAAGLWLVSGDIAGKVCLQHTKHH